MLPRQLETSTGFLTVAGTFAMTLPSGNASLRKLFLLILSKKIDEKIIIKYSLLQVVQGCHNKVKHRIYDCRGHFRTDFGKWKPASKKTFTIVFAKKKIKNDNY
jgi:hypothetical protein